MGGDGMHEYTLIRSKRKTAALQIKDGVVEVRAPLKMPKKDIDKFVASKEKWLTEKLAQSAQRMEKRENFSLTYGDTVLYRGVEYPIAARSGDRVGFDPGSSPGQAHSGQFYIPPNLSPERVKAAVIKVYKMLAERDLTNKVVDFAKQMSVKLGGDFRPIAVKINSAKTRWGSCSNKKSINFSWRLIMAAEDIIDVVVVHELAHITEMNHSKRFWAIVEGIFSDYRERGRKLKEFSRKINSENWDVDWEKAVVGTTAPGRLWTVEGDCPYKWHYADYKTILSPKNGKCPLF